MALVSDVLRRSWRAIWPRLRPILGWCCIVVGVIWTLLPIPLGFLVILLGAALIGRRNQRLRWMRVHGKLVLRYWACCPHPLMQRVGQRALRAQHRISSRARQRSRHLVL